MSNQINIITNNREKAVIKLLTDSFTVVSNNPSLKSTLESVLQSAFTQGVRYFHSPTDQKESQITITSRIVKPGDPNFAMAIIRELESSLPGVIIDSDSTQRQSKELRNKLRKKLADTAQHESLRPFLEKMLGSLDKLDNQQVKDLLKDIDDEDLEELYGQPTARELKQQKKKRAPKGGTLSGQRKKVEVNKGYTRSKKKPLIKVIDRTKK